MYEISTKHIKKVSLLLLYSGLILLGLFIALKLSFFFAPFLIALIFSSLIEPMVRYIMRKTKVSRKAASLYSLLFVLLSFGIFFVFIIAKLVSEAYNIYDSLPDYYSRIYSGLNLIIDKLHDLHLLLPKEMAVDTSSITSGISSTFTGILNSIIRVILDTAISIPDAIIFVSVTILSTYFFTCDKDKLINILNLFIPQSLKDGIESIKNELFSALFGYLKAQLILMSITFTELGIGFTIIGINSPILLSLVISIIDALPILGTGIILIPWSIYCLASGDIGLSLSIIIIYAIVFIVRQMIEPKILGRQLGVHPLLTLLGMYTGLNLLGFIGLILGPITVLLLKSIVAGGLISKKKSLNPWLINNRKG